MDRLSVVGHDASVEKKLELRPLGAQALAVGLFAGPAAFIGLLGSLGATGRAEARTVVVTVLAGALVGLFAARRTSFATSAAGVEIHNLARRFSFSWDDVEEVGVRHFGLPGAALRTHGDRRPTLASGRTPPGLAFRLRNGTDVPAALSTIYLSAAERKELISILRDNLEPRGVTVPISEIDLEA